MNLLTKKKSTHNTNNSIDYMHYEEVDASDVIFDAKVDANV